MVMNDFSEELEKAQAELTRLRSLVLRPKRIEWRLEDNEWIGCIKGDDEFVVHPDADNEDKFRCYSIIAEAYDKLEYSEFDTAEEAKAACQSAFDAWIGQFMEVVE